MTPLKAPTIKKIHTKGQIARVINTPRGAIKIWTLEESRGSSTGFRPKTFRYVELPAAGKSLFFSYSARFEDFWKLKGFI